MARGLHWRAAETASSAMDRQTLRLEALSRRSRPPAAAGGATPAEPVPRLARAATVAGQGPSGRSRGSPARRTGPGGAAQDSTEFASPPARPGRALGAPTRPRAPAQQPSDSSSSPDAGSAAAPAADAAAAIPSALRGQASAHSLPTRGALGRSHFNISRHLGSCVAAPRRSAAPLRSQGGTLTRERGVRVAPRAEWQCGAPLRRRLPRAGRQSPRPSRGAGLSALPPPSGRTHTPRAAQPAAGAVGGCSDADAGA